MHIETTTAANYDTLGFGNMYSPQQTHCKIDGVKFTIPFATKIGTIAIRWIWVGI